jgi:RNA polymerase sigma-54 factor
MPRNRLSVTQTQRLQLTAGLQASIHMLRADAPGLTRYLEEQCDANPHLRLDPAPSPAPGDWLPRWTGVIGGLMGGLSGAASSGGGADAGRALDQAEAPAASLMVHVMEAINRMGLTPQKARIAHALAEALEPSGWLGKPLADIARDAGATVAEVEQKLARLQRIEPAGLFARNLAECLALQLTEAGPLDGVMQVILGRLDLLAAGDMAGLARLARTTPADIAARFRVIRSLDPKPGAQFAPLSAAAQREPDLLVRKTAAGEWEVSLNRSCLPTVSVLRPETGCGEPGRGGAPLAGARAVVRLLEMRNDTLLRVGREVLQRQRAALDAGPPALVAMSMAEVAEALGLHESTVSRVVAGASVDTPRGTWWVRRLFSGRVGANTGEGAGASSGAAVRARLAQLVASEPKSAPLSDAALALALATSGVAVARRTIAKYRAALGIPPVHRRKIRGLREKPEAGA